MATGARSIAWARVAALVEASTYLVLMAAVVWKYLGDQPAGVSIMGPVHGILVLVYAALLWVSRSALGWEPDRMVSAIVLGAVPFGGYWVERNWLR